jgi:Tfp pilus assembly protein PilE
MEMAITVLAFLTMPHYIKNIRKNKIDEWNTNLIKTFERWSRKLVQSEGILLQNVYIILEFCLAISSTSAPIQKVFSLTNGLKKRTVSLLKPSKQ